MPSPESPIKIPPYVDVEPAAQVPPAQGPSWINTQVLFNNLDLSPATAAVYTQEDLRKFMEDVCYETSGGDPRYAAHGNRVYDGYQITPTRAMLLHDRMPRLVGPVLSLGRKAAETAGLVPKHTGGQYGTHPVVTYKQSWSRGVFGGLRELNMIGAGSAALLVEQEASLKVIADQRARIWNGDEFPVTVYGGSWRDPAHATNFKGSLFSVSIQVGASLLERWGMNPENPETYTQFREQMLAHGISGVTIDAPDLFKIDDNGKRMSPVRFMETLAAPPQEEQVPVSGILVSVARTDLKVKADRDESMVAARSLLSGDPAEFGATRTGQILASATRLWYSQNGQDPEKPFPAVFQATHAGLKKIGHANTANQYYRAHRVAVATIRQFTQWAINQTPPAA